MKEVKILGAGCQKCSILTKLTEDVINDNNIDAKVTKVEDIMEIIQYGIISTPAFVVDEQVIVRGRIPSANEIKEILLK